VIESQEPIKNGMLGRNGLHGALHTRPKSIYDGVLMAKTRPSVQKRKKEAAKLEKRQARALRRASREKVDEIAAAPVLNEDDDYSDLSPELRAQFEAAGLVTDRDGLGGLKR
jgi:hypothetical protein